MNKKILCLLLLGVSSGSTQAAMTWQPAPPEAGKSASAHMGHGESHGGTPYLLQEGQGAEAEMWLPTRVRRPLKVADDGRVSIKNSGVTSYHLLFAKKDADGREDVAMRYISLRGKPSGESPASLVNTRKTTLDITPAPLTREHQRYTGGKAFDFIVSFNGEPVEAQPIVLSTSNGTKIETKTDARGQVTLRLPDDFTDVEPGRSNNRPAEFVLSVFRTDSESEKSYRTTLSAPYYVSPSHWQSMTGGLLAMFAGVVTGLVVLRRSTNANTVSGRV